MKSNLKKRKMGKTLTRSVMHLSGRALLSEKRRQRRLQHGPTIPGNEVMATVFTPIHTAFGAHAT